MYSFILLEVNYIEICPQTHALMLHHVQQEYVYYTSMALCFIL
jgi:hypothetical protein